MTKTMWTSIPAGVLGQGNVDVRPYPGVVVCPTPGAVQGSGLPIGGDVARLRSLNGSVAVQARIEPATQHFVDQKFTQHDGTTLGIHSSGRPQS